MGYRYLYIFEDGDVCYGFAPTESDLDCAINGSLQILDLEDGTELNTNGEWVFISRLQSKE